jgi:beta-lactamase regulating signal transducer with metallopeptidase domain
MSCDETNAWLWLLRTAIAGSLVLAVASGGVLLTRQPARREHLGACGVFAALLVAVASVAPAWLPVSLPTPFVRTHFPPLVGQPGAEVPAAPDPGPAMIIEDVSATALSGNDADSELAGDSCPASLGGNAVAQFGSVHRTQAREASDQGAVLGSPQAVAAPPAGRSALTEEVLRFAFFAYALLGSLMLLRWLMGHFLLWRLLNAATTPPAAVSRIFGAMTAPLRRQPRLLVSGQLSVPMSCGLFRPTVVIPGELCRLENAVLLRWVFAHELTHLERRDARTSLLFGLAQAVYFFCPLFWWLRRQVRLCQEYIADAAVSRIATPEDYAQFLITLANAPAAPVAAAGITGKPSDLFRRIAMLLEDSTAVERKTPRSWSLAAAVTLVALATVASGIGLSARPLDEPPDSAPGAPDRQEPLLDRADPASATLLLNLDMLQDVPADKGAIEDKLKELREAEKKLEQASQELKQAMRKLREQDGGPPHVVAPRGEFAPAHGLGGSGGMRGRSLLLSGLSIAESRLGIRVEKPTAVLVEQLDLPPERGLVIIQLEPKSAAEKAGLKPNDILLEFDDKPVHHDVSELPKIIGDKAGVPVNVIILRKGKKETITGLRLPENKGQTLMRVRPVGPLRVTVQPAVTFQPDQPLPAVRAFEFDGVGAGAGIGRGGAGLGRSAGGIRTNVTTTDSKGVFTTLFRNDDRFTARHQEGTLVITLTGKVAKGKAEITEIAVEDGAKTHTYDKIDEVPERYRDKVKNLAEMSEGRNAHIEVDTR